MMDSLLLSIVNICYRRFLQAFQIDHNESDRHQQYEERSGENKREPLCGK